MDVDTKLRESTVGVGAGLEIKWSQQMILKIGEDIYILFGSNPLSKVKSFLS